MMRRPAPPSLIEAVARRDRTVVSRVLAVVVTASWVHLLTGAGTSMYPHEMAALAPELTGMASMSMAPPAWTPGYALLMFTMWWLMMIAMMLPSAAPMILVHGAVTRRAESRSWDSDRSAPSRGLHSTTTAFVTGYLVMWGVFSVAATAAQWWLEQAQLLSAMMMPTSPLLASGLLIAAGLWQLSPLKTRCLRHCRSPAGFLAAHWRPGVDGAFRMGIAHGGYCLGCCWFLMALLFYGGVMNLVWIAGLALLVLIEKTLPAGVGLGRVAGVSLLAWGSWLAVAAS